MNLPLSARDDEILLALVQKVRLFSLRQIATHWWDGQAANARRRLRQLTETGWLQRIEVSARTLPELLQPVLVWQPGEGVPNCEAAAYQMQRRWHSLPVRPLAAFIATDYAARIYGGKCRGVLKHPLQATHDLGVAQIWLRLRATAPEWAAAWRGEDLLADTRRAEKCPDAFIVNPSGLVVCILEFGGAYQAQRIREFHDDCAARGLPYQIW